MKVLAFAAVALLSSPLLVQAEDVAVEGTHLCCGQCVKVVGNVLKRVKGVSDAACDREARTIKFKATNAKVARQAIRRLRNAGFGGTAKIDGKAVKVRKRKKGKKARTADTFTYHRMHLCCGGCVTAATKAAKTVKGVESVEADRKARTITVKGKKFEVAAVRAALEKEAGLASSLTAPKKRKKKGKN